MSDTYAGKHRDNSNRADGKCARLDRDWHRGYYKHQPRHNAETAR